METPQEHAEPEGADSIIDLTTPDGEVRAADPEEGDGKNKDKGERREEPARDEPVIIAREDEELEEDPDVPRRRGESKDDYSRRVRGRINREIALRKRTERRLNEQTAVNDEMRDRLAKIERRQTASQITDDAKKSLSEINTKIEAKKAQLAAAIEAGETAKQLDLNIELSELIADKKIIERRSEYQAEQVRKAAEQGGGERDEPGSEGTAEERRIARATAAWQAQNRKWWNLNRFRDVKADAIELDKDLREEVRNGDLDMEEYSDEYFAELSTRLKQNYPDLDVRGLDGEAIEEDPDQVDSRTTRDRNDDRGQRREQPRQQRRPAVGNMGTQDRRRDNGGERQLAQQGRVRLGQPDYATMRRFGLDPNNETHKKRFARERMRTILTDGSGPSGGGR
jgi:hypothetical protein